MPNDSSLKSKMHRMPYKGFENAFEGLDTGELVNQTPVPIGESPVLRFRDLYTKKRVNPPKMIGFTIGVRYN